jgi:zinc transport system substrate-binding protein
VRRVPDRAWIGLGATAALFAGLAGCGDREAADPRPLVAVSVAPQAFVVDRLAETRVRVEIMVPPGASPVTYEPTIRQLRALAEARLYVAVGHPAFPFESAWLEPLLSSRPELPVIETAAPEDATADEDPHVWVTPAEIDDLAERLAPALAEMLPDARAGIAANLAALRADIARVDARLRERLAHARGRRFLVLHPAWGHLAEAYGLEQVAIERGHKSPDAHAVAELIETTRAAGARVVFVQPQFDTTAARLIAQEIGARVVPLDPLARDWQTNMLHVADALAEGLY